MKPKTKKSITKRFRITKNGKILRRPSGHGHYNAKKTGKQRRQSHRLVKVSDNELKKIKRLLKY